MTLNGIPYLSYGAERPGEAADGTEGAQSSGGPVITHTILLNRKREGISVRLTNSHFI